LLLSLMNRRKALIYIDLFNIKQASGVFNDGCLLYIYGCLLYICLLYIFCYRFNRRFIEKQQPN
jgi:hypothetical protein